MARRTFVITLSLMLLLAGTALAAGALHGKTYKGSAASTGVSALGHRKPFAGNTAIALSVASNGKTVKVSFPSNYVILYCNTTEHLHSQSTKPAKISSSGSFTAKVGERFRAPTPGEPAVTQVVTGHFSGGTVRGTIHTEAAECGGVTSFTAKA